MNPSVIEIVLVDDHPLLRRGLKQHLSAQDDLQVVGEASSCAGALEQVCARQPRVVVMDLGLPDGSGIETTARILERFPGTKVVVLSADWELSTVHRALEAGAGAYVTKQSPPEDLVRAIREVVNDRVYLCPEVASLVVRDYVKVAVGEAESERPVLTDRERELIRLVAEGKRNKEIAEVMQIEVASVETARSRLMRKLKCSSPAELTRYAIREGIVTV